jgi:hypothetical protein
MNGQPGKVVGYLDKDPVHPLVYGLQATIHDMIDLRIPPPPANFGLPTPTGQIMLPRHLGSNTPTSRFTELCTVPIWPVGSFFIDEPLIVSLIENETVGEQRCRYRIGADTNSTGITATVREIYENCSFYRDNGTLFTKSKPAPVGRYRFWGLRNQPTVTMSGGDANMFWGYLKPEK